MLIRMAVLDRTDSGEPMILEGMITRVQYLQEIAPRYGFHLDMSQMQTVGLVALIVISAIIILDLPKKFRRPKKKKDE